MDDKAKIFQHLQARLLSVNDDEDKESRNELEKQIALARIFLRAEKKYDELRIQANARQEDPKLLK